MFLAQLIPILLFLPLVYANDSLKNYEHLCKLPAAKEKFFAGFEQQANLETDRALESYKKCLEIEPKCVACHYEIGWSYWKKSDWKKVIYHWDIVLGLVPKHAQANEFMDSAKNNLKNLEQKQKINALFQNTPMLTQSEPKDSFVNMTLIRRFQSYQRNTASKLDVYEPDISSPKSVLVSPYKNQTYVNSLEDYKTLVYDSTSFKKINVIQHKFESSDQDLFAKEKFKFDLPKGNQNPNVFQGKPVELALSHGGRYLWVSYYRRSFDPSARFSSAVAVVDTSDFKIVRVFPTASIPKYVEVSPGGKYLAISHWGENTILLLDISGTDPKNFNYDQLLVVEKKYTPTKFVNRDKDCGFCVRGLSFSNDDQYLFVARMRREGIQVFHLLDKKTQDMGAVMGHCRGPRDIQTSPGGEFLYVSCNANGIVMKVAISKLVSELTIAEGIPNVPKRVQLDVDDPDIKKVYVGLGARSLKVSPDGRFVFASVSQASQVVAVQTDTMNVVSRIKVDSYPVGLDISADGSLLWTTSQARGSRGGNSVNVYQVRYRDREALKIIKKNSH